MKFLLYTVEIKNPSNQSTDEILDRVNLQQFSKIAFNYEYGYFISDAGECDISIVAFFKDSTDNPKKINIPFDDLKIDIRNIFVEEITSEEFYSAVYNAEISGYIRSARHILIKLRISRFISQNGFLPSNVGYQEYIAQSSNKRTITSRLKKFMWYKSMEEELDRIYTPPIKKGYFGIPVHYILKGNCLKNRDLAVRELVSALYQNKRIKSQRYCEFSISNFEEGDLTTLDKIYDCYSGGVIVIKYRKNANKEGGNPCADKETIEKFCEQILLHKNDVQTIFCFPLNCAEEKDLFISKLSKLAFIEMEEDCLNSKEAIKYILDFAKEKKFKFDEEFLSKFSGEKEYALEELNQALESYEDSYPKNVAFPQYKQFITEQEKQPTEKDKGDAYERLQNLIGLSEAKKIINNIINFAKVQKVFKDKKGFVITPTLHMCFTGAPGTAKTTVARLVAEILKDNQCLSTGQLVECSRADLVGKYVGHTAQQVKQKFIEAIGGVLFIDEAYSLIDDRNGLFGDEAINTIVQCMENYRDDLVVIFAGYPDQMEEFLNKNPGLKSRIAFHVPFNDYNAEELYSITKLLAKEKDLKLSNDVKPKLMNIYEKVSKENNFGNGRYARNLMEKAIINQASRLVKCGFDSIQEETISTIIADDFVDDMLNNKLLDNHKIGFCLSS